jgi:hypothetical protein
MGFWLALDRGALRRGAAREKASKKLEPQMHADARRWDSARRIGTADQVRLSGSGCEPACRTPVHPRASVCICGSKFLALPRAARFRLKEARYGTVPHHDAACLATHGLLPIRARRRRRASAVSRSEPASSPYAPCVPSCRLKLYFVPGRTGAAARLHFLTKLKEARRRLTKLPYRSWVSAVGHGDRNSPL